MKKNIFKHIFPVVAVMAASGCADDNTTPLTTDSAKTPVNIAVAVADAETSGKTRAVDKRFESNDVLVAHLQHVSTEGTNQTLQVSFEKTITLTMNADVVMTSVPESTNTQQTTSFTTNETLYWDDFSDATHDIRAEGHGLRSAWGYCYNGNSSAPSSDNYSDIRVWSVATDQKSGIKSSDLLWSKTQEPVAYTHDKNNHGTITIPYTHAMSKATIELTASDGFGDTPFNNTSITLTNVNTKGKFTASTATVQGTEAEDGYVKENIKMHKKISADGKTAFFDCLFVPNTLFTPGNNIAKVEDVEGNNYDIVITDAMVRQWGRHSVSGTNYKLVGTLKKQAIGIVAQITDWTEIESTGNEGQIKFSTDFTFSTQPQDLGEGTSYDVFMTADKENFEGKSTTRTLVAGIWTDDPVLYWKGEGQKRYFRGLAKLEKDGEGKELITTVDGSLEANQGTDLLWATTTEHTGTKADGTAVNYEEGDAIDPRTSAVPLQFSHAMSKVKFVLTTSAVDADDKVDLTGATISIADVYTKGTVSMDKGIIGGRSAKTLKKPVTENSDGKYETEDCIVIPQSTSILTKPETAKTLVITLNDNTTYSLKLPECKDDNGKEITDWKQGNYYVYTIKLTKAAIGFRAMIKDWNKKTGSGNASLDWD